MAINKNSSNQAVIESKTLYTGLCHMKVIAINPTKDEAEKLGIIMNKEPEYIKINEIEITSVRLDFYLKNEKIGVSTKLALFLTEEVRESEKGKTQFIDNCGRVAWAESKESLIANDNIKWINKETLREARVGEEELYAFLQAWQNVKPGDECMLDKFSNLFKGDFSELKSLVGENEVEVLLTVRESDGKLYQSVYNKRFSRTSIDNRTYWISFIKKKEDEGYPIKDDFGGSVDFKEYLPVLPDSNKTEGSSSDIF